MSSEEIWVTELEKYSSNVSIKQRLSCLIQHDFLRRKNIKVKLTKNDSQTRYQEKHFIVNKLLLKSIFHFWN